MSEPSYRVSVAKDYLVFAAGHFITYGDSCEALHGHNYRVSAELEGSLDENALVFNFVTLKKMMRELVDELDHKMLVPLENARMQVREEGDEIELSYRDKRRRYVFPRQDVVLLPIPNTTAEMLARHFAHRLRQELGAARTANLSAITIEVEEVIGQAATYRELLR